MAKEIRKQQGKHKYRVILFGTALKRLFEYSEDDKVEKLLDDLNLPRRKKKRAIKYIVAQLKDGRLEPLEINSNLPKPENSKEVVTLVVDIPYIY